MFEFVAQPFLRGILPYEAIDLDFSLQLDFGFKDYDDLKLDQIFFTANFFDGKIVFIVKRQKNNYV